MPSKSKDAHVFKVGDNAVVRHGHRLVNAGKIVQVAPMNVVFEGSTHGGALHRWAFKRKGTRWVERKRDCNELEPTP